MMFKNSLRLLSTNFSEVWKLLVYHILSIGICLGLLSVFYNEYMIVFDLACKETDLLELVKSGTFFGSSFTTALAAVIDFALAFFRISFEANIILGLYFIFIVGIVFPVLLNIGKIVTCELMYGYMSSCQKQSFTGTLLKTLKTSLSYSFLRVLYSMPFNAVVLAGFWSLTRLNHPIFDYLLPFIVVIVIAILLAFKSIFTVGWAPAKVVYNHNIVKSYFIGMRAVFRRGLRVFSTAFVIYLLAIVLSMTIGIYSIIIILPIVSPLIHIFEMVVFFSSQGMRFYVDNESVISPKKLEEVDRIEDIKHLI